jgi:hypothetical protein
MKKWSKKEMDVLLTEWWGGTSISDIVDEMMYQFPRLSKTEIRSKIRELKNKGIIED